MVRWKLVGFFLVAGCSASSMRSDSMGIGSSPGNADSGVDAGAAQTDSVTTSISGSAEGGGDASSDEGGDNVRLDVGAEDEGGGVGGDQSQGCTAIDLLFVIDGSISMDVAQDKLRSSLDSFVAAMEEGLVGETDYHLGVVTTTAYPHNVAGCGEPGSLIVQTGGNGASGQTCGPFTNDAAFLTSADDPLADNFECMAQVGLGNGNVELTADAILAALAGDGPGGCNAGFARPDALLVVVTITDTDDPSAYPPGQGSAGDPAAWFASLVALRGGVESNIVMISIIPPNAPSCTVEGNWSPLFPGPLEAPRLTEFTQMFSHHYIGDICANDYGLILNDALAAIEIGCDEYTPVG